MCAAAFLIFAHVWLSFENFNFSSNVKYCPWFASFVDSFSKTEVGIGLSYRLARLRRLAELLFKSLKIRTRSLHVFYRMLCGGLWCFNLCLISGLLFFSAPIHSKQIWWESESNQDLFNNIFYSVWILIAYWVNLQFKILCYDRFVILHWNCVIPIITRWAWATCPPSPPPPTRIQPVLRLYSKRNVGFGTLSHIRCPAFYPNDDECMFPQLFKHITTNRKRESIRKR
jgi:hypothetical protein